MKGDEMTHLHEEQIKKLTELCRIDCTPEEEQSLLGDLEKILAYVDQLQEINTENVKPCNHVLAGISNVMRDDVVGDTLPRELFLSNAPAHINGRLKVPTVIGKSASSEMDEV